MSIYLEDKGKVLVAKVYKFKQVKEPLTEGLKGA